jgi:hypothetical protein
VEGGEQVGAEVHGVEDEMDGGVGMLQGVELVLLMECGLEFVLVVEFAQDWAVFKLGLYKLGCSS